MFQKNACLIPSMINCTARAARIMPSRREMTVATVGLRRLATRFDSKNITRAVIITRAKDEREAGDLVRALQMEGRDMTGFSPAG